MSAKKRNKHHDISRAGPHSPLTDIKRQLLLLKKNTGRLASGELRYYDEHQDLIDIKNYYKGYFKKRSGSIPSKELGALLEKTHKNQPYYMISKNLYLYPWVDLYPDGSVKSIYSGERKDPQALMIEDRDTLIKKAHYLEDLFISAQNSYYDLTEKWKLNESYKMNTEHIVPQSWFGGSEPMKGDLHHLFTCQPDCNIARSNFPYTDFSFYNPEVQDRAASNKCGMAYNAKFEPEHGKGPAARAMLYFLMRYPNRIKRGYLINIDRSLLFRWHREFPPSLYEKHRNQAIYYIQGNRNPLIDFPEIAERLYWQQD